MTVFTDQGNRDQLDHQGQKETPGTESYLDQMDLKDYQVLLEEQDLGVSLMI